MLSQKCSQVAHGAPTTEYLEHDLRQQKYNGFKKRPSVRPTNGTNLDSKLSAISNELL